MKSEQDDLLKRLASKAKRKLNKENDENIGKANRLGASYEFVDSDRQTDRKKLEKKIVQLLKNNPDCDDPIGKLIDHCVFDGLSDERKQAYILKLSQNYSEIKTKLMSQI